MSDRNLDIALRIKADMASARSDMEGFNKTLGDTATKASTTSKALEQASKATAEIEAGTRAAAQGVKQLAETEAEATARIRAVIAASRERVAADQAAATAATRSGLATQAQAAAATEAAAAIQRQTAQAQRWTIAEAAAARAAQASAGATAAEAAELAQLLGQIDPTIAALERLDQQQQQLQRFRAAGLIDDEGFTRFQSQINASRAALGRMGVSAGQTQQALRMLPAQITDVTVSLAAGMPVWMVFLQQGAQIKDSFGGIRPAISNLLSLITPTRLALGATVVTVGLLATALVKGYLEAERLDTALIATGNYAGETASSLGNLADQVGVTSGGYAAASQAVLLLAESGKVTSKQMGDAARGATAFAALTGKSIQDAVAAVVSLGKDPVEAVRKLDEQYHFLETSTYAQIRALQEQGRETEAATLAQRTFADAMQDRQQRDVANLGTMQRAWKSLNDEVQHGWDLLKGIGSASIQAQLDQLYAARGAAQSLADGFMTGSIPGVSSLANARIASIDNQIEALKEQAQQEQDTANKESAHRQQQEAGNAALDRIAATTAKYATAADRYKTEIEEINKNFDTAIKAMPAKADELNRQRDEQLRAAVSSYAKSLAGPAGRSKADDGAAEARRQAEAAASAQQDLVRSLQQLQGQLDPTAAAWLKYNDAVATADKQAALAKTSKGANVAAIDAERNAVVALADAILKADIDKIAEKDRQAWESLRESLRTPTEVKLETAMDQIQQLNALLARGVINAQQYHDSIQRVGANSVVAAPKYQGIDAVVGGAAGELDKNLTAGNALEAWHAQQLAANEAFRAKDLANEEAYQARRAEIEAQYAAQSAEISQARQQLALAVASQGFADLAGVAKAAYGEQSKQYQVMFALSKGFAVAQAAVSLATNVAKASEAGFPYNIPFIIGAIAQGASIAAMIAGANFSGAGGGGYAEGGWTGPGSKYKPAGVVHAEEFVNRREVVAQPGARPFLEDFNRVGMAALAWHAPGYADGGYVNPLADAPAPSVASNFAPVAAPKFDAASAAQQANKMRLYLLQDVDQLAQAVANHPAMEKKIVVVAGENGTAIRSSW